MLDTNTVSHLVRQHPNVARPVLSVPMASLCTSAITVSELLSGLAKRPDAARLQAAVTEPMRRVDVLQWDISAAKRYGILRAARRRAGRSLGSLDMLIAAHALAVGAVLVTNDRACSQIAQLQIEDWTVARSINGRSRIRHRLSRCPAAHSNANSRWLALSSSSRALALSTYLSLAPTCVRRHAVALS